MLKRCLSPLTLVNQVALIVLLSTAIGLAGMAVSGWLVQGVQGSAHAINKAFLFCKAYAIFHLSVSIEYIASNFINFHANRSE